MGHLLGPKKINFLIRVADRRSHHGSRAGLILSIPVKQVSLGSPRVGTIHVRAPTPHAPPLQSFVVDFSELYEKMRCNYASLLFNDTESSRDELVEAVAIFEELTLTARRVYGPSHPQTKLFEHHFELSKSDPRLVVRAPSV